MKTYRIMLGILAIIPLGLLAYKLYFYPTEYDEHLPRTLIYLGIGVPILILNVWAWLAPDLETFFFKKDK